MTLRQTGEELGGRDYAAVSIALKRWETRSRHDRKLQSLRKQILEMLNVET
jgi:hypothetical protein